jgi:hypothetical protein
MHASNVRSAAMLGLAVLLASGLGGCSDGVAPTAPTPAITSTPVTSPDSPAAATPSSTGSLYGVVTEMTSAGSVPVEGVSIAPLSCARANCAGSEKSVYQEVTTGKDGTYRVAGLYNSQFNYVWLGTGWISAAPRPVMPCEGCDLIVTVNGDTRLDITVIRP